MRWKVLFVRPCEASVDEVLAVLRRVGVDPEHAHVETKGTLVSALQRSEWDVVIYDPATKIPLDVVYQHAPGAAVVNVATEDEMADELARIVATRSHFD